MAIISWDNYVDDSSITNSTASGTEILDNVNLKTRQLGDVFRHSFSASGTLLLDFDLGSALATNLIAILNHDMAGLTYSVKFGTTLGASDVGTEGPNTFWTGTADDSPNEMLYLSSAFTARYVRLEVTIPAARTVDIGRVWLDSAWDVSISLEFSLGIDDPSTITESRGGSVYDSSRRRKRMLICRANGLSTVDIVGDSSDADLKSFLTIDLAVGTHGEIILMPLTDTQVNRQRLGVYGHMSNSQPIKFLDKGGDGFISEKRFTLKEDF